MKSNSHRTLSALAVAAALLATSGAIAAAATHAKPRRAEFTPTQQTQAKPLRAE